MKISTLILYLNHFQHENYVYYSTKTNFVTFCRTANLMNGFQMNGRVVDPQKQSVIVELLLMKKTQARLQQKVVSARISLNFYHLTL